MTLLRLIRDNIFAIVAAILLAFGGYQKVRADRKTKENKELEHEVQSLEIEVEAHEVRSRPVPRDKSDVLGRM